MAEHDWLEIVTGVVGVLFLALAAVCAYALVVDLAHLGDVEMGFPAGESFVKGMKGFGIAFFGVLTVVCVAVGWFLVGEHVRGLWRRLRARREAVR
jgi:hypothetical protein